VSAERLTNRSPAVGELSNRFREMLLLLRERSPGARADAFSVLREGGLSASQTFALLFLADVGPRAVSDIADYLGLSPSAASSLIDKLVNAGLLRRWEDQTDRRQRRVELSATGKELVNKIQDARAREFDRALGVLTPGARKKLESVVDDIVAELRHRRRGGTSSLRG
jgi:DNA-binding MarR family transcriptional regulator